jgi:molybdate transport system substrate-binding protein
MRSRPGRVTLAALAAVLVAGCGGTGSAGSPAPGAGDGGLAGAVTVFAAASLAGSFTRLRADFEATNPGVRVSVNFAGSSGLARQISEGAPADVFASASPTSMAQLREAGAVAGEPAAFGRNRLLIAVAEGNPLGITGPTGLTRAGVKVALCAEQVPCGEVAAAALAAAGVRLEPATLEQDVKAALAKLTLGEVDAALVYRTDALAAASDVDAVEFPDELPADTDYQIAVLRDAPNPGAAQAFVDHVRSAAGAAVLAAAGFQIPEPSSSP